MSLVKWINFTVRGDKRGQLVILEQYKNIPFNIERVYYMGHIEKGVSRGFHAHKVLQQIAVCICGKCQILLDDGCNKENVWLNTNTKGLLIDRKIWHEMHDFSEDCVLLILADAYYDESDYIRDYQEFIKAVL